MRTTKLQPIHASFEDICALLEATRKFTDIPFNWLQIREEWMIIRKAREPTPFYRTVQGCHRLGLITYEKRRYFKLQPEGQKLLDSENPKSFLGKLLLEQDKRFKVLEAIRCACKNSNLEEDAFIGVDQVIRCLEDELGVVVPTSYTLKEILRTIYQSIGLVKCEQGKVRLNAKRYEEVLGRKEWRSKDEIPMDEFFKVLVRAYEELSAKSGTKYVPIPEIRSLVCIRLNTLTDEFNGKFQELPRIYRERRLVLVSARGPRPGDIEVGDSRYYYLLID